MNFAMKALASTALLCAAMPASAAVYTFTTTTAGNYASSGSGDGNSYTFTSTAGGEHVTVSGWQISQASGNAVASQTLGLYSPGFGVTGTNDYSGNYGYHQIDNAYGYTDFALLTFDHAVTLTNIGLNSFNLGDSSDNNPNYLSTKDNDLVFLALTSPFNAGSVTTSGWTTVNGTGADGTIATGSSAVSRQWLIGAAFNSGSNDGFKVASLKVNTSAVPEPATWAMMLVGFGAVGASMRRRRPVLARQAA